MIAVRVEKGRWTDMGSPQYDYESDLLYVEIQELDLSPFGLNIDSLVIVDLDDHQRLMGVEFLVPRRLWKRRQLSAVEEVAGEWVASFPVASRNTEYDLPVEFYRDRTKRLLRVTFGGEAPGAKLYPVAPKVGLLMADGSLAGIDVIVP